MKLAILTMNYRCNYGGILQCLALQNTLKLWGHDVDVIKYSPKTNDSVKRKIKILFTDFSIKDISHYVYDWFIDKINIVLGRQKKLPEILLQKCSIFISENINYTELCDEDTIGKFISFRNYDAIIFGSDKIWGGLAHSKLVYMGDWEPSFSRKLISYAACSSQSHIPQFNVDKITTLLKRFHAISVRDQYTKELFKNIDKLNIKTVLDPAFLYDFNPYLKSTNEEPYILAYILGREIRGGHNRVIELLKKKYGNIKVKAIVLLNESTDIVKHADEVYYDATPVDWINMIYNAKFIYTDSFHGVVFSLKFQKPFIAYYQEINRATRLVDLRDRFKLGKNIISSVNDIIENKVLEHSIDYAIVNKIIEIQRQESLFFLQNALS